MDLLWPLFLTLLLLVPLAVGAYIWMLRRKRRFAVRYSSLSLIRAAMPQHSRLRRHLPFALFLLAMSSLILAMARPVTITSVPAGQTTIVLALDVSRSMCSNDIAPTRLHAAKDAAQDFIRRQPSNTQIGIVAFAGFAEQVQSPTTDQEVLADVVESLITGRRTAIGSAILESIDAIAEVDSSVAPSVRSSSEPDVTPVPDGAYAPSIIVLLTDGASNAGPEPLLAAQQAADRGVRVYTIGFGTANGGMMDCSGLIAQGDPWGSGQGDPFGGGWGGGGGRFRRGIDEETLMRVSEMTGAEYYAPESADELQEVFENLPTSLIMRHETTEVSFAFTSLGALLVLAALGLSMKWNPLQ